MTLADLTVGIDSRRKRCTPPAKTLTHAFKPIEAVVIPVISQKNLRGTAAHEVASERNAGSVWADNIPRGPDDCLTAIVVIERDVPLLRDGRNFEHLTEMESKTRLFRYR
jgi:hypothetical protein